MKKKIEKKRIFDLVNFFFKHERKPTSFRFTAVFSSVTIFTEC